MFQGKMKALTFSYDDGVTQDIRFIELLNKYGLKGTFNINSSLLGQKSELIRNNVRVDHIMHQPADIKHIYQGHEVAAHTLLHPFLPDVSDDREVIHQVEQDRLNLSELVGYEVVGMAYPGGGINCNDRIARLVREHTGIQYARTVPVTHSFDPFPDRYQYQGTLYHHVNWDELFQMGQTFLDEAPDTPKVFYLWGHSYEFDIYPERWGQLEEFFQMMSGRDDIFYGTNREVLLPFFRKD